MELHLRKDITNFIKKKYHDTRLILLTGSQLQSEFTKIVSDIDILLIGNSFTGVSSQIIVDGKNVYDITRIGYYDLHDILIKNMYDINGTLLDMICQSSFLDGDFHLFQCIREKALLIKEKGNPSFLIEYKKLRRRLNILKKHVKKDLHTDFYHFMVMDFSLLTTSTYLLFANKGCYPPDAFRQIKQIKTEQKDEEMLKNLIEVSSKALVNFTDQRDTIIAIIEKYLSIPPYINYTKRDRYIISLSFENSSKNTFYSSLIDSIKENNYLSKFYLYSFCGDENKFILKNDFSLIFNSHKEGFKEQKIIQECYKEYTNKNIKITNFNIIHPEFLYIRLINTSILYEIEQLLSYICNNYYLLSKENKLSENNINLISFSIINIIIKSFNFTSKETNHLLKHYLLKCRPTHLYENITDINIKKVNNKLTKNVRKNHLANKDIYEQIFNIHNIDNLQIGKFRFSIIENSIKNIINNINRQQPIDNISIQQTWINNKYINNEKHNLFIKISDITCEVLGLKQNEKYKIIYSAYQFQKQKK